MIGILYGVAGYPCDDKIAEHDNRTPKDRYMPRSETSAIKRIFDVDPSGSNTWLRPTMAALPVAAFIGSLIWPANLAPTIGGLFLPLYRIFLLVLLPMAIARIARTRISLMAPDYFIVAFALLQAISLMTHYGLLATFTTLSVGNSFKTNTLVNSGVTFLETLGPYFLARAFVRTRSDVVAMARMLISPVIAIGITALIESITGRSILLGHWRLIAALSWILPGSGAVSSPIFLGPVRRKHICLCSS